MFDSHAITLTTEAQRSADVLADIGALVLLTIRQPFEGMPAQFHDVKENGRESRYLFGSKRPGFDYIQANKASLWDAAKRAYDARNGLNGLILEYLQIPGLGIVKASFYAQMTIAQGACLDGHNLKRLGLPESAFRTPKSLTLPTLRKRVAAYNRVWRRKGDSAFWWDSWCEHVAAQSRNGFTCGEEVSALHLLPLHY